MMASCVQRSPVLMLWSKRKLVGIERLITLNWHSCLYPGGIVLFSYNVSPILPTWCSHVLVKCLVVMGVSVLW